VAATDQAREIEERIAELKRRWPAHSAPPRMWQELEELESELEQVGRERTEGDDGGQAGAGRLPQM
jgi:hypothetical protein